MSNSNDPKPAPADPADPAKPATPPGKGPQPDDNVKPPQKPKIGTGAVAGAVVGAVAGAVIGAAIGAAMTALGGDD
jgi:uncharacterized membrane protein